MWMYDKKLEYPIKIKKPDPMMARNIITQYGGPDGELAASLRYLSQRFSMITPEAKATLNDIGTEELAHLEMVGTMVKQLTENASIEEMKKAGFDAYYSDHDKAVYPVSAAGVPFTAAYIQSKGDPITDLYEDMAAEQKARSTYEYLINLASDPDVIEPLRFLREREIVHFQRFGESLRLVQEYLENKKRFSIPKTLGARAIPENTGNMPGRRIGDRRVRDNNSIPAMQMTRNVPISESRGVPSTPTAPSLPGLPINPQMPTSIPGMTMPGAAPPGMNMPGNTNMPDAVMPNRSMMPGRTNMPGAANMPNMPNQKTMPNMPDTRDMRNAPGTSAMPEIRRIQKPQDTGAAPKK